MWSETRDLTKILVPSLTPKNRKRIIKRMFNSGGAMGWLMSSLILEEIFSHGRPGARKQPEADWLFTDAELDTAIQLWIKRARAASGDQLINSPDLISVLLGWKQSGHDRGLSTWISRHTKTDEQFLAFLNGCRGWMQSDKTYYPLNRRELESLIDYDAAQKRLHKIAKSTTADLTLRAKAEELLEAARIGK
jgi:hypothetical protein